MAWDSTLATADEAREYIGTTALTDAQLEPLANASDAQIQDDYGVHPVVEAGDSASVRAAKERTLARRKLAFLALVQLEAISREQRNPTFRGTRMGAENIREQRADVLSRLGARPTWLAPEED